LPNTSFDTRLASESTEAFHAFSIYRDLGLKRNLDEVSRRFDAEKRGSGLRLVRPNEVRTKHRKSGKIGLWSRKYQWVERAAAWDRIVDQRLREKQLDEIERMAKRQAQEAQVLSQVLMAPVVAFATGLKDPNRARTLENRILDSHPSCLLGARTERLKTSLLMGSPGSTNLKRRFS
jgi:hypothetical protein